MFPLSSGMEFTPGAELAIALALGLGFGFALERAGFGSARKLTAVFYLYDMAVVKVMFTAIVTTMVGLIVFSTAGWLDLSELYLEPTNFAAAIVGGVLFGAGFIVGGYCPGTAIAASAVGRRDAWSFALGILAGVWTYATFTPGLDDWVREGQVGEMTLPTITNTSMSVWVLLFLAFLAFAGWGMARLEKQFTHWKPAA